MQSCVQCSFVRCGTSKTNREKKRKKKLSSNENIFKESLTYYEDALKKSNYNHEFKYNPTSNVTVQNKKNRKRNLIRFNPPYSLNVSTKIGNYFLHLISKHFPQQHTFHKIFNKNNIKVSYSCMPNINSIINSHNKKITNPHVETKMCNCIQKDLCPLKQNCLTLNIIYQATLSSNLQNQLKNKYIGLCETTFKTRYTNHKKSFNTEKYKNSTALSKEFWRIKELNGQPNVSWKIIRRCQPFNPNLGKCNLCLNEKFEITSLKGKNLLNTRSEMQT